MIGGFTTCKVLGGSVARLEKMQEQLHTDAALTLASEKSAVGLDGARIAADARLERASVPYASSADASGAREPTSNQGSVVTSYSYHQGSNLSQGMVQSGDMNSKEVGGGRVVPDLTRRVPELSELPEVGSDYSAPQMNPRYVAIEDSTCEPKIENSVQDLEPVEAAVDELHASLQERSVHSSPPETSLWIVDIVTKGNYFV